MAENLKEKTEGDRLKVPSPADRIANACRSGRSEMDCDKEFLFLNRGNTFLYITNFAPERRDYSLD